MNVDYINPFISAASQVFTKVLSCPLNRTGLKRKRSARPEYDVSGIIGLTGRATGTVVLSLSREVALEAAAAMLGMHAVEIDSDVVDAIGELVNMIGGGAKTRLEAYDMRLSLPTVIVGRHHMIKFGSAVTPLSVSFECPWGPLCLDVSLVELDDVAPTEAAINEHAPASENTRGLSPQL